MQALITRPLENAATLATALAARGVASLVEPMLAIRHLPATPDLALDLQQAQAILFTSSNGVRAFAAAEPGRASLVLAVGDATAATARALGFGRVESAGGDVADLARLVRARLDPARGPLLHAAGSDLAGDLAGMLASSGFSLRRAVLYRAEPASQFSAAARTALGAGKIAAAFFFSPRTATHFVTLARRAGLTEACRGIRGFCLSPAVANALSPLAWTGIITAAAPEQDALLAAFDRLQIGASAEEASMAVPRTPDT